MRALAKILDYYAILGVHPSAEEEVIAAAYKALAKKYHPDTASATASATRFVELQEAYDVLRDPVQRKQYDEHLANAGESKDTKSQQKSDERPAGTGNNKSYVFSILVGALVIASVAMVVEVATTLWSSDRIVEASPDGAGNPIGKTSLTNEIEGVDNSTISERSSDNSEQQPTSNKQIYDRLVGDQEITGEKPRMVISPETLSETSIGGKNGDPELTIQREGKGNRPTIPTNKDPARLPEAEPPPQLPIPGSDQQG